jgi:RNA polymerase sigma-70 factor (ECF subfamily)
VEEVLQQIQVTLLVATPDAPPRITQYRGAGSLLTWVKVMVIRELRKRSVKGAPAREEELGTIVDRLWGRDDPEHDALLRRHRPEIQAIVRDAVQSMAPDDRMLLKLGVVDGVSTVKLGPRIGLNQSTVWRKLDRIKRDLNQAIHDHLKKRFNLSTRDLESMMNALRSSLDLSISQIFGKGEEDDSDENA